jgi:hypothetical protein
MRELPHPGHVDDLVMLSDGSIKTFTLRGIKDSLAYLSARRARPAIRRGARVTRRQCIP